MAWLAKKKLHSNHIINCNGLRIEVNTGEKGAKHYSQERWQMFPQVSSGSPGLQVLRGMLISIEGR